MGRPSPTYRPKSGVGDPGHQLSEPASLAASGAKDPSIIWKSRTELLSYDVLAGRVYVGVGTDSVVVPENTYVFRSVAAD